MEVFPLLFVVFREIEETFDLLIEKWNSSEKNCEIVCKTKMGKNAEEGKRKKHIKKSMYGKIKERKKMQTKRVKSCKNVNKS